MELREAVDFTLSRARTFGEAEVVGAEGDRLEVGVRLHEVEKLKRSRERRIAVRIFVGRSSAVCATADLDPRSLADLVTECRAMAGVTASDPFSGLPDATDRVSSDCGLELYDPSVETVTAEEAIGLARAAEEAALGSDPRLTNSEGAEFSSGSRRLLYATAGGFEGEYRTSSFSLSVVPVAAANGTMQRDYWYSSARMRSDLRSAEQIGREAARRTLRRLGARAIASRAAPVVFDAEMAASLVGHFAAAASGSAIYRGTSFLADRLGQRLGAETIQMIDDPLLPRGLGSRPFDAEGIASRRNVVLGAGVLESYLLDTYSARKLGLQSTASAVRALGEAPFAGPSNFYLARGEVSPEEIVASIREGLYVTELIGPGVNPVTGDYSRGACGLWIENGQLAFPVEEVTIAGNLREMLAGIEMIGNDLAFRATVASPTLKVGRMTVAGAG